jgi:hypothetical protein
MVNAYTDKTQPIIMGKLTLSLINNAVFFIITESTLAMLTEPL